MKKQPGKWALVWLGGDASGYEQAAYMLGENTARSVLAAAALNKLYPEISGAAFAKRLVLVPETLFTGDHCRNYRLLLEAKTGYRGKKLLKPGKEGFIDLTRQDPTTWELLDQGFSCTTVPHPGLASPRRLDECGEEKPDTYTLGYDKSSVYKASFEAMLNNIYAALRGLVSGGYSLVIDLTHGTNPLVSAALLAAAMIRSVYGPVGVEAKLYMAPLMGRPDKGTQIEFIEMTPAAETVNTVASGINAWEMLDERLLPIRAVREVGSSLGRIYGRQYGGLKATIEKSAELLWSLRSGQAPVTPPILKSLQNLWREASKSLEEMMKDKQALHLDTPWAPVADAVTFSTKRLIERLLRDRNDDTILAALEELTSKDMPDRALGPARELVVALLLAKRLAPGQREKIGEGKWSELSQLLNKCSQGTLSNECSSLGLSPGELAAYDRARKLRNRLMHGRLSKEENIYMKVTEGRDIVFSTDGKPLSKPIDTHNLKQTVNDILTIMKRIREQEA